MLTDDEKQTARGHAVNLEQCSIFVDGSVDGSRVAESMTDAAVFLRGLSLVGPPQAGGDSPATSGGIPSVASRKIGMLVEAIEPLARIAAQWDDIRSGNPDSPDSTVVSVTLGELRALNVARNDYLATVSADTNEARAARDPSRAEFIQGFAAAVASIARDHDRPTIAASVIVGSGLRREDFEQSDIDAFDLKPIRRLFRTEAQLRTTSRGS